MSSEQPTTWHNLAAFWAERLTDAAVQAGADPVGAPLAAATDWPALLERVAQAAFAGEDIRVRYGDVWRRLVSAPLARHTFLTLLAEREAAGQALMLRARTLPPEWLARTPARPRHRQHSALLWETTWLEPPALLDNILHRHETAAQPLTVHFDSQVDVETADLHVVFATAPDADGDGFVPLVTLTARVIDPQVGMPLPLFVRLAVGDYQAAVAVTALPACVVLPRLRWAAFCDAGRRARGALRVLVGSGHF